MHICVCNAERKREQTVGECCVSNKAGPSSSSINLVLCNVLILMTFKYILKSQSSYIDDQRFILNMGFLVRD